MSISWYRYHYYIALIIFSILEFDISHDLEKKEIRKYFMKSRKVEYLSYSWKQLYKMKLNLQLIIKMKENPLLVYFLQEHLPFLFKSFQVYDILILKTHFTFYVPDSTRVFRQKNQASRDPAINLKNFRKKQVQWHKRDLNTHNHTNRKYA